MPAGAIRSLSLIDDREARAWRNVDYKNLGPEELSSVYESLLELHPQINVDARSFALEAAGGNERKTSGSYYTLSSLIKVLLDSALDPVLDEAAKQDKEAILNLKVCDPATGSGHFLIAATNRIKTEALEMLDLDKHPGLQGGRLVARLWRSNPYCTHRVAGGENLFRLALRYHTTSDVLKRHNYLSSDLISIGQGLPLCPKHMMEMKNTRICFKADGALVFIDTTSAPPAVYSLQTFTEDGFTCASSSND